MARGSTRKVTVKFEAVGDKALVKAVVELARAQGVLEKNAKQLAAAIGLTDATLKRYIGNTLLGVTGTRNLGGAFSVLRSKLLLVSFAMALVGGSIGKLVQASGEQEEAEKKLELQLGGVNAELLRYASSLQKTTTFGDEETIGAMATAGAYTTKTDTIKKLTKAAMDYAVFSDKDLNTAMSELTRSVFSATNMLSRQGIVFEGAVGSSERLENALAALRLKTEGLAEVQRATATGAIKAMGNSLGDLAERMGSLLELAVIPLVEGITFLAEKLTTKRVIVYTAGLAAMAIGFLSTAVAAAVATGAIATFFIAAAPFIAAIAVFTAFVVAVEGVGAAFGLFEEEVKKSTEGMEEKNKVLAEAKNKLLDLDMATLKHSFSVQNLTKEERNRAIVLAEIAALEKTTGLSLIDREIKMLGLTTKLQDMENEMAKDAIARENKQLIVDTQRENLLFNRNKFVSKLHIIKAKMDIINSKEVQTNEDLLQLDMLRNQQLVIHRAQTTAVWEMNTKKAKFANDELAILNEITQAQANLQSVEAEINNIAIMKRHNLGDQVDLNFRMLELSNEQLLLEKQIQQEKLQNIADISRASVQSFSEMTSAFSTMTDANMNKELNALKASDKYKRASSKNQEKMEEDKMSEFAKVRRNFAIFDKTISGTQAGINTLEAVTRYYAKGQVGMAIAVGIMGALQVGAIAATPIPTYQYGGLVGGNRHGQGGTMIEAEQGEYVMSRNAVDAVGIENLNRMNQGGGAPVNVTVTGNVMTQDFVEGELAEAIRKASSRGTDFGVS